MVKNILMLLVIFITYTFGAEQIIKNHVYDLSDNNFDEIIEQYPIILVYFYPYWCRKCYKKDASEYTNAAKILKQEGIYLAKFLCYYQSKIPKKLHINGFPTVILFKNGIRWVTA